MKWNSLAEFIAMGGYGLYVWGSVGICLLCMVAEPLLVRHRLREVRATLRRERIAEELESS